MSVSKFGGGVTRFQSVVQRFSPGFETNDVGFQSRADEQMFRNWFSLQYTTPKAFLRQGFFNFNTMQKWTTDGLPLTVGLNTNWHVQFNNQWWGHIGANGGDFTETYNDREARGGPAVRKSGEGEVWAGFETDRRRAINGGLFAGSSRGDDGNSSGWWVNPNAQFRISSQFSGSLGGHYNDGRNDKQWRANFGVSGADTTHYTFARLDQKTLGLSARINYTASPTLSLQFYAQPFVSNGDYSNWRELADPRAATYDDRFKPFTSRGDPGGFTFRQFTSNSVLRWEYMPGSTLFLVWAQGRQMDSDRTNEFSFRRDLTDVFSERPDNTFLIKVSYWFNP